MQQTLKDHFRNVLPKADFCSLRYHREKTEIIAVRQDVPEPVRMYDDAGAMVTVVNRGGIGYAATCDLSAAGLKRAVDRAVSFAAITAGRSVCDFSRIAMPCPDGEYTGPEKVPWESFSTRDTFDLLRSCCARMKTDDRIVDRETWLGRIAAESVYLTGDGGRTRQRFSYIIPSMRATANDRGQTQVRTLNSVRGCSRQGGMEQLDRLAYEQQPERIADEALELLSAENCPAGTMDMLLASSQMMLQIHESIGHPLEVDRILGDERNYAGTSFVTTDMFGSYRYGSELLNITFDPTNPEQLASYGYDDDGLAAHKKYIIRDGILLRGLGGVTSQARSGLAGTANSRASGWNRPPIDRMANLNLETGTSTLDDMITGMENGVYMQTNRSWSIDDSRNKFQFGCEYGQLIKDGEIVKTVRNPNYRGISAVFWRNLAAVGDESTYGVYGTPYCGKGEPNQIMRVGHASPACVFADVDVFGGES